VATQAGAQPYKVLNPQLIPHQTSGKTDGCELMFNTVNGPPATWKDALAVTWVFTPVHGRDAIVMLKAFHQAGRNGTGDKPLSLWLTFQQRDNRSEVTLRSDETPPALTFWFHGPTTTSALQGLLITGQATIVAELSDQRVVEFPVDFREYAPIRSAWARCWQASGGTY
jgi:hypothetical protein